MPVTPGIVISKLFFPPKPSLRCALEGTNLYLGVNRLQYRLACWSLRHCFVMFFAITTAHCRSLDFIIFSLRKLRSGNYKTHRYAHKQLNIRTENIRLVFIQPHKHFKIKTNLLFYSPKAACFQPHQPQQKSMPKQLAGQTVITAPLPCVSLRSQRLRLFYGRLITAEFELFNHQY